MVTAYYSEPPLLFSVAPRHQEYVRSPQCSNIRGSESGPFGSFLKNWNVGWVFQIITFLGRSWDLQGLYVRVVCCFCDELEGRAIANKCVLVQTVSVLNSSQVRGPLLLVYRFRHDINQSLEKVKCWMDYLVLFFPWKKLGVQFPSDYVTIWYCTGKRSYRKVCHKFFYQLQCDWFHACPEYRSLPTGLWVSHKRSWLPCCWVIVCMRRRGLSISSSCSCFPTSVF